MAFDLRSVRALILEPKEGFRVTLQCPVSTKSSDAEHLVGLCKDVLRALVLEIIPGFHVTTPLETLGREGPYISIHVIEDEIMLHGDQPGTAQKREIRGPDMARVCLRLHDEEEAAVTAVVCHAWGEEMRFACKACKSGPFGQCITLPDRFHNACSNCILMGHERSCEWWTSDDLDTDKDYCPPKRKRQGGRTEGHTAAKRHKDSTPEDAAFSTPGGEVLSEFIDLTKD
ncbi:hypothetical protein EKO27_g11519 [Xylaria grammica]|uniref:Uncharacterized protein n=1 Tax=Xylaria grammica TaxID=363999 RepID=A0A439CN75_9PEZI|nr:hypothetical protein EKO27_g11519 [Xylaria grammica]